MSKLFHISATTGKADIHAKWVKNNEYLEGWASNGEVYDVQFFVPSDHYDTFRRELEKEFNEFH